MKFYLAGPMTGFPCLNFPLFIAAAAHLRQTGHVVVSPVDLVSESTLTTILATPDGETLKEEAVTGETLGQIIARDVQTVIDDVDGVIFLPCWERSSGARIEALVGLTYGDKLFAYYDRSSPDPVYKISRELVRQTLKRNIP